jgi:hypothetical protein
MAAKKKKRVAKIARSQLDIGMEITEGLRKANKKTTVTPIRPIVPSIQVGKKKPPVKPAGQGHGTKNHSCPTCDLLDTKERSRDFRTVRDAVYNMLFAKDGSQKTSLLMHDVVEGLLLDDLDMNPELEPHYGMVLSRMVADIMKSNFVDSMER